MFNKDNNDIKKIEIDNKELYPLYNDISITPYFVIMLNNYHENNNLQSHNDFENNIKLYKNNCHKLSIQRQYDNNVSNLYHNGIIVINNEKHDIKNYYIVYKKNEKNYYLIDINSNKDNNIKYDTAVKLIDTTAFISLINKSDIQQNMIIIDSFEILENIVNNWDGKFHNKVYETDAITNKLGNIEYE